MSNGPGRGQSLCRRPAPGQAEHDSARVIRSGKALPTRHRSGPAREHLAAAGRDTQAAPKAAAALPSSFQWSSTGPLLAPKPDAAHPVVSVKDATVIQANGKWHVFMTTANTSGAWSMAYTSFTDWSQAGSAPLTYLDTNPNIGTRYAAAPQVFYFAPKGLWYLVYQTGPPSYSTSTDPGNPNNFRNSQLVLQDSKFALFEGDAVYRVQGTNTYLLMMEAIGSNGRRYYRSFTAQGLTGQWQPLAATEANPFARSNNVSFPSGAWTQDISHGELIRTGNDQTMTINSCRLHFLYQGMNPSADGDYSQFPWRLGLLTQTNNTC
ncbi:non-reducing end alpha-L-arabinofuranosidase family hydrolase [Streptomyces sp. NPDC021225]|uniref:non-reducing end alpha-L-arabinofuranosidase family hydrolase n=1 Tax=Streptomyces sp. NPDC021225 TaxID=3365121 RepID=UPI0037A02384